MTPMPTPQEQCESVGGRWDADMCTSAADLVLAAQRAARASAIEMAQASVDMVDEGPTDAEVGAAEMMDRKTLKAFGLEGIRTLTETGLLKNRVLEGSFQVQGAWVTPRPFWRLRASMGIQTAIPGDAGHPEGA